MLSYLKKQALFPALLKTAPAENLGLIITIPCHNETDLGRTLAALAQCVLPACGVEVVVLINGSEKNSAAVQAQNAATYAAAMVQAAALEKPNFSIYPLLFSYLPPKHAGVGLARKIAMDEAIRRFLAVDNSDGVLVCLDADSLVEQNYLLAIYDFFEKNADCHAASIHYEHPLVRSEIADFPPSVFAAITAYELHLRYYVHALKKAGLPTATQTVGSSMAVRAAAYAAQGGMNRRKAGEDFYFIHKFTGLGGYRELSATTIIPSPRVSDRVPFGTGKAVGDMLAGLPFLSYNPLVFKDLACFLPKIATLFSIAEQEDKTAAFVAALPPSVSAFLEKENFQERLQEIYKNTKDAASFEKRFFQWFDAFLAMKFVHFARDGFYPNMPVFEAAHSWLTTESAWDLAAFPLDSEQDLLLFFRGVDKRGLE